MVSTCANVAHAPEGRGGNPKRHPDQLSASVRRSTTIEAVTAEDLEIEKEGDEVVITANYSVKIKLFGNLSAVHRFRAEQRQVTPASAALSSMPEAADRTPAGLPVPRCVPAAAGADPSQPRRAAQRAPRIPRRRGAEFRRRPAALRAVSRNLPEGDLSRLRASLVNQQSLVGTCRIAVARRAPAPGRRGTQERRFPPAFHSRRRLRGTDRRRFSWTADLQRPRRCWAGSTSRCWRRPIPQHSGKDPKTRLQEYPARQALACRSTRRHRSAARRMSSISAWNARFPNWAIQRAGRRSEPACRRAGSGPGRLRTCGRADNERADPVSIAPAWWPSSDGRTSANPRCSTAWSA